MTMKVGFIGLGNIGKPMAINVAKGGFDLLVYDLNPEPLAELSKLGAKVAGSAREIGSHGEIFELVVANDAQVEAVTILPGGLLETAKPGSIIAIHSTVLPATIAKVADAAKAKGVIVIDAQVSGGGRLRDIGRDIAYMVGGDKAALDRCRPVFETSASRIFHLGPLGSGAIAKIINNLIHYVNRLAAAEGLLLAENAGLNLDALEEVIGASSGQSYAFVRLRQRIAHRHEEKDSNRLPSIVYKDLDHALALGHQLEVSLPAAALTQQFIDRIT